jgi:hypothetical protein
VTRSESPIHLSFWVGDVDPRPLALFRILFGLTLLHDLANLTVDLRAFLTDEGMLPRGLQVAPRAWSLFHLVGSPFAVGVLFALGCCAVAAFTVGYYTRLATLLSFLFITSVHTRNLYVTDGGDDLVRNLLFLSLFADLGACFSLDTRVGRRKPAAAPAMGLRFLQLHVALLYFCAARLKFRAGWLTHNVIYQCLQLEGFVRPPGAWLSALPSMCFALGVLTVGLEWSFAFLAFSPFRIPLSRALAVAAGLAVQVGILATMRVGVFTEAMIAVMVLFTQPEWLDRASSWLSGQGRVGAALFEGPPWVSSSLTPPFGPSVSRVPALRAIVLVGLSLHFIPLAWGPFIARRFPPPAWVMAERQWLWLDQPFGLFDVVYDIPRWEAPGILSDGSNVEVLSRAVPALVPKVEWNFSRWYKFTFKERERPFRFAALGTFQCSEYERRTGARLQSFTLVENLTPPMLAGGSPRPTRRRERWHQSCSPQPPSI